MTFIVDGTNGLTFPNSTTQVSAGVVLQVVQGSASTAVYNSTTTYADTGLSASITPKFSTSKILVLITHPENYKSSGASSNDIAFNLCRNGSQIQQFTSGLGYTNTATYLYFSTSFNYLDSPATTSSTTYKTQFKNNDNNGAQVGVNNGGAGLTLCTITLLEIAG